MTSPGGRFQGRVGFVTGGGTGIGLACARRLVEGGGRVLIAGRREEILRDSAASLGDAVAFVRCDVTDETSVESAVSAATERFGGLHLAVNSAGTGSIGHVLNATPTEFAETVDTNLTGVFRCMRAEARAMKASGGGSIVNISSIAAVLTHRWWNAYCASKAGVNMLTRCAADDLGELGIRVNAVMPSLVPTELAGPLAGNADVRAEYLRRIPAGRLGTVEDVAGLVAFLLSDEASWVTGQCIGVDGGHTIRQGPDITPILRSLLPDER